MFFDRFRNLVTQRRVLRICMVFISIPAPPTITFQGVVPSSSNEFCFFESELFVPTRVNKQCMVTKWVAPSNLFVKLDLAQK